MATRKSPVTTPIVDGERPDSEKYVRDYTMNQSEVDKLVKLIRNGGISRVIQIKDAAESAMKRLRLKASPDKAISKVNENASDQVDLQSFVVWCNGLPKRQQKPANQLIAIHATAIARTGG